MGTESSKKTRYILAFGDSLTEGFTKYGLVMHPYANRLQDLLHPGMGTPKWQVTIRLYVNCDQ